MNKKAAIWILVTLISTCVFSMEAYAQTMYVSDSFEITMRTGPGADRKIISLLRSGAQLEVVTPGEEWTEVRLQNGKQGWVLTRYLTDQEPKAKILARVQNKYQKLQEENQALIKQIAALKEEKSALEKNLKKTSNKLARLENAHNTLKKEASDFLGLKAKYEKTTAQLAKIKTASAAVTEENRRLKRNHNIKWFLSGAGVLLFGWIIGMSSRRSKRRSSLL